MLHRPRLIPCMLLNHGDLVKTVRFKEPNYLGDPINAMKIFNEKCVDELCVQDISASKEGRVPDFDLLRDMAEEAFMPLSYGGGITTLEDAARLFHIGFEKVILNTAFFEDPELITRISERFGAQSVTVSLDVKQDLFKRYRCFTKDGTVSTGQTPQDAAHRAQELGAGEILLNSIDRDGMMPGLRPEADSFRSTGIDHSPDRLRRREGRFGHEKSPRRGRRPRSGGGKYVRLLGPAESGAHQRPC